jgi:Holin of 3TMs, for gene-transfer release
MADEEVKSASELKKEDWMNSKWRPMMGWMYMLVCTMDFVGFPILWSLLQSLSHGSVNTQWQPLTLQGAGLFHIAMGAVIGISAYGRTQEKLGGANNGGLSLGSGTTYTPPAPVSGGFGNGTTAPTTGFASGSTAPSVPQTGSFGAPSTGFGSVPLGGNSSSSFTPPASWGSTPTVGTTASGKKIVPDFGQPAI